MTRLKAEKIYQSKKNTWGERLKRYSNQCTNQMQHKAGEGRENMEMLSQ